MDYVVVQAGGRGSRLGPLTANKPKALVPVDNLPMVFHLFKRFPTKHFIVIADYKSDVFRAYLPAFAQVSYELVEATGTGTCAGLAQAMERIPDAKPFMLIWSDLVVSSDFKLPEEYRSETDAQSLCDYVGLAGSFSCRWKYENGLFAEERSNEFGVAGLFLFSDKSKIAGVPDSGEFVRWLQTRAKPFKAFELEGVREYGLLEQFERKQEAVCRPFNRIIVNDDKLEKQPLDAQGEALAVRERAWYKAVSAFDLACVPHIYQLDPLTMEFIPGGSLYTRPMDDSQKQAVLAKIVRALKGIHGLQTQPADKVSLDEAYFGKTMNRLQRVRNLIPFADRSTITVNGKTCRNVFFHVDELKRRLDELACNRFALIHGDCTFSNILLRGNGEPVLIDPRGYFGHTELFGDPRYDWAKLYYSIVGNYDQFNAGRFTLEIGGEHGTPETSLPSGCVRLSVNSNGWESCENLFFEMTSANAHDIRLIHAIIWLSLTTYAWQNYDSICGAFYNGLYYLEDVL